MDGYKLGVVETRFAELIWQHEPLTSGELVKLCEQELQWKKSTTYTVLKKLCEHGIFQNENGTVTSLLSQEGYNAVQSEKFVEDTFDGSLPAFLAAFTKYDSSAIYSLENNQFLFLVYPDNFNGLRFTLIRAFCNITGHQANILANGIHYSKKNYFCKNSS